MLVDCPKCGFNQPEDQYCAQCGVDMQNYKPKPKPLWVRVTNKPSFHITMALLIAAGVFTWIYISQKQNIDQRIRSAFNQPAPATVEELSDQTTDEAPEELSTSQEQQVTMAALAGTNTQQPRSVTPAPTIPKSLKVSYAEVPRALIEIWVTEGEVLNETANTRSILLQGKPEIQNFAREEWGLFKLPGGRTLTLTDRNPRDQYLRQTSNGEEIGFALEIAATSRGVERISIDLQMLITLPGSLLGDPYSTTMTGTYNFPTNATVVILGGLPQQGIQGDNPFSRTPLQILSSPEYIGGTSEFAIFLQTE